MATKPVNFKMDETELFDMKKVAKIYDMSMTQFIKNAIEDYITKLKADPFYKLTANVQDASDEESAEILTEIEKMSDDDLKIVSVKRVTHNKNRKERNA